MENKQNYSLLPRVFMPRYQYVVDTFISISVVAYIVGKIYSNQDNKNKGTQLQANKRFPIFDTILSKINGLVGKVYYTFQNKTNNLEQNNNNYDENTNTKSGYNPDDYFHALHVSASEVPANCTEPFILKGYVLPDMPWKYYLKVLYYPTNETFNVWTHLLPALLFTKMLYNFNQEMDLIKAWPLLVLTTASIILTLASSLAHTFHSRSDFYHRCWFMFDYFGITCYAYSSTMCHFLASSDVQYYNWIGVNNLIILSLIACVGFYCCSISQLGCTYKETKCARRYKLWSNMIGYFYGIVPIIFRSIKALVNGKPDQVLFYHFMQVVFMVLSPVWYASDIPQKYWPGKFDILGHSHQIFHIFCATSCYFDVTALYLDITNSDGTYNKLRLLADYPTFQTFLSFTFVVFLVCLCLSIYFVRILKSSKIDRHSSYQHHCAVVDYLSNTSSLKRKTN